jgi:hypothetical protein
VDGPSPPVRTTTPAPAASAPAPVPVPLPGRTTVPVQPGAGLPPGSLPPPPPANDAALGIYPVAHFLRSVDTSGMGSVLAIIQQTEMPFPDALRQLLAGHQKVRMSPRGSWCCCMLTIGPPCRCTYAPCMRVCICLCVCVCVGMQVGLVRALWAIGQPSLAMALTERLPPFFASADAGVTAALFPLVHTAIAPIYARYAQPALFGHAHTYAHTHTNTRLISL